MRAREVHAKARAQSFPGGALTHRPKRLYHARFYTRLPRHFPVPMRVKTNPELTAAIDALRSLSREHHAPIWRAVAERLERPRKNWSEVNLSRVARHAAKGAQVVVPGVLLSSGSLPFPVTLAAFRASAAARKKVEEVGGIAMPLLEFARAHRQGTGVQILG